MESLQLALLLSRKPCPKLPRDGPNLGFRPFTQVWFGSSWRNHAKSACLMARSCVNISGGGGSGAHDSFGNDSERKMINLIPPSDMINYREEPGINYENLEDGKYQLLENQLNGIQDELRKNNEKIKMLRETATHLLGRLLTNIFTAIRMEDLIDKNREHAQQIKKQMNQLRQTHKRSRSGNEDLLDRNPKKKRRQHGSKNSGLTID